MNGSTNGRALRLPGRTRPDLPASTQISRPSADKRPVEHGHRPAPPAKPHDFSVGQTRPEHRKGPPSRGAHCRAMPASPVGPSKNDPTSPILRGAPRLGRDWRPAATRAARPAAGALADARRPLPRARPGGPQANAGRHPGACPRGGALPATGPPPITGPRAGGPAGAARLPLQPPRNPKPARLYLLDTNVVSELRAKRPRPGVLLWIDANRGSVAISIVTVQEIQAGAELARPGAPEAAARIEA